MRSPVFAKQMEAQGEGGAIVNTIAGRCWHPTLAPTPPTFKVAINGLTTTGGARAWPQEDPRECRGSRHRGNKSPG